MTVRDVQRGRVYDAEQLVRTVFDRADENGLRVIETHGSRLTLPVERRFASLESVRAYAEKVLALNWVRARWARAAVPVHVRERRGATSAHYERLTATLAVPLHSTGSAWALREFVVLHELAHHLEPDPDGTAPHGPEYCGRFSTSSTESSVPEAAFLLRATMLDCGVKIG